MPPKVENADVVSKGEDLTSTQYVILAENQRKKASLLELKIKYEKLLSENRQLLEEREANQQETYEVTEFLRKEILKKNEKLISLEAILEQREADFEVEREELDRQARAEQQRQAEEFEAREKELTADVEGLRKELTSLRDFKDRKLEVEQEMDRLREENEDLRHAQEALSAELERKFIEQNTKQKKEYEQKLEELKKLSEENIDERLDASVKRILQQNRRMAEELRLHVQETDELQRQKKTLEEDCKRLHREVELKKEIEEQYAKRGSKQMREIRDHQSKVAALERSLGQVVKDFDREREAIKERGRKETADLVSEQNGLQRLVKLKTRELKNIRRLAQEVVQQRSEVEAFLIDSLRVVKRHITQGTRSMSLPPISGSRGGEEGGGSGGAGGAGGTGRVEIGDLSWEDREKVLRLLFSKINNAAQESYFASLPPHSFEVDMGGTGDYGSSMGGGAGGSSKPPTAYLGEMDDELEGGLLPGQRPDIA